MPSFNTIYERVKGSKPLDENKDVYSLTNPLYTLQVIRGIETLKRAKDREGNPATEPWQEMIDSHKEETDINVIISRSVSDPSFLDRRRGSYVDVSSLPKNLSEVLSKATEIRYIYSHLDLETKAKYSNVDDWVSAGCPIPEVKTPEIIKDPPATVPASNDGGNT